MGEAADYFEPEFISPRERGRIAITSPAFASTLRCLYRWRQDATAHARRSRTLRAVRSSPTSRLGDALNLILFIPHAALPRPATCRSKKFNCYFDISYGLRFLFCRFRRHYLDACLQSRRHKITLTTGEP